MEEQKDLTYVVHVHAAIRHKQSFSNVRSNCAHSMLSVFTVLFILIRFLTALLLQTATVCTVMLASYGSQSQLNQYPNNYKLYWGERQ